MGRRHLNMVMITDQLHMKRKRRFLLQLDWDLWMRRRLHVTMSRIGNASITPQFFIKILCQSVHCFQLLVHMVSFFTFSFSFALCFYFLNWKDSSLKLVYEIEQTEYLGMIAPQGRCMRKPPKELLFQFLVVLIVSTSPCSRSIFCTYIMMLQ